MVQFTSNFIFGPFDVVRICKLDESLPYQASPVFELENEALQHMVKGIERAKQMQSFLVVLL